MISDSNLFKLSSCVLYSNLTNMSKCNLFIDWNVIFEKLSELSDSNIKFNIDHLNNIFHSIEIIAGIKLVKIVNLSEKSKEFLSYFYNI